MSIIIWAQVAICTHIGLFGTGLYMGRVPLTKEILPDFRERCRVTRHSRVLRGLTGSQRTPGKWGVIELHPYNTKRVVK